MAAILNELEGIGPPKFQIYFNGPILQYYQPFPLRRLLLPNRGEAPTFGFIGAEVNNLESWSRSVYELFLAEGRWLG